MEELNMIPQYSSLLDRSFAESDRNTDDATRVLIDRALSSVPDTGLVQGIRGSCCILLGRESAGWRLVVSAFRGMLEALNEYSNLSYLSATNRMLRSGTSLTGSQSTTIVARVNIGS